jgi:hypothetical protein
MALEFAAHGGEVFGVVMPLFGTREPAAESRNGGTF